MSVITYTENRNKILVPFENGVALADFNSPEEQGLKWAYSLGKLHNQNLIVLGLGGGFQIAALLDMDPELKITVVEFRSTLISRFRNQFSEYADRVTICELQDIQDIFKSRLFSQSTEEKALVISFQECWGECFEKFALTFSYLTGKTEESLVFHLREHGMTIKARLNTKVFAPKLENPSRSLATNLDKVNSPSLIFEAV